MDIKTDYNFDLSYRYCRPYTFTLVFLLAKIVFFGKIKVNDGKEVVSHHIKGSRFPNLLEKNEVS